MANKITSRCEKVRRRMADFVSKYVGLDTQWVQTHVAQCPKCQKRFARIGKVELALTLLKTQPHSLDLLARANSMAVGMLQNSIRNSVPASKLKIAKPEPHTIDRFRKYSRSIANTAACFVILALLKAGIFSAMDNFEQCGEKMVTQYYSEHSGEDLS